MADFTMYDREREFKWQIECQLRGGTNAYIDAEDIYSGRLTRQISSGEGIEVGSCYVSELDLTIVASALPTNVISVKPYFRLLTSTEIVEGVVRNITLRTIWVYSKSHQRSARNTAELI